MLLAACSCLAGSCERPENLADDGRTNFLRTRDRDSHAALDAYDAKYFGVKILKEAPMKTETARVMQDQMSFMIKSFFFVLIGLMFPTFAKIDCARPPVVVPHPCGEALDVNLVFSKKQTGLTIISIPRGLAAGVLSTLPLQYGIAGAENFSQAVFALIVITIVLFTVGFAVVFEYQLTQGMWREPQDREAIQTSRNRRCAMIARYRAILILFGLAVLSGCASTKVTQKTPMESPGLARPNRIYVYDFIADPAKVPADSYISADLSAPTTPPTGEELETGRRLGAIIAKNLVADIQAMGLSAVQAGPGSAPQVGDGVIRGYFVSVQGGSAAKRFVIGFGAGSSEMYTVVEGYEMTPEGLKQVGSGTLSSSEARRPAWSHRARSRLRPAIR